MAQTYFKNFSKITYSNNEVVDITQRVAFESNQLPSPDAYYPIQLTDNLRADHIAYEAYSDPYMSWLIYMNNNIVDPYYDWYLNQYEFTTFIKDKYGSIEKAQSKIKYWRNDWIDKPTIPADTYQIVLSDNQKHFWEPNTESSYYTILDYRRKQEDWTTTTNYIIGVEITPSSNTLLVKDEVVNFSGGGTAQVIQQSNSSYCVMQHTQGILSGTITGRESGAEATVDQVNYLANNITSDTISYWTPVSYYEYENEKNESKKNMLLLKPELAPKFVNSVKKLLS